MVPIASCLFSAVSSRASDGIMGQHISEQESFGQRTVSDRDQMAGFGALVGLRPSVAPRSLPLRPYAPGGYEVCVRHLRPFNIEGRGARCKGPTGFSSLRQTSRGGRRLGRVVHASRVAGLKRGVPGSRRRRRTFAKDTELIDLAWAADRHFQELPWTQKLWGVLLERPGEH